MKYEKRSIKANRLRNIKMKEQHAKKNEKKVYFVMQKPPYYNNMHGYVGLSVFTDKNLLR